MAARSPRTCGYVSGPFGYASCAPPPMQSTSDGPGSAKPELSVGPSEGLSKPYLMYAKPSQCQCLCIHFWCM
uniref:Uncharacterized protein n=1 Tax=Anguilla anguilla TaxID=7936 RepID=A0A0E9X6H2_ANGAN